MLDLTCEGMTKLDLGDMGVLVVCVHKSVHMDLFLEMCWCNVAVAVVQLVAEKKIHQQWMK